MSWPYGLYLYIGVSKGGLVSCYISHLAAQGAGTREALYTAGPRHLPTCCAGLELELEPGLGTGLVGARALALVLTVLKRAPPRPPSDAPGDMGVG
jgi:hypothetical protein